MTPRLPASPLCSFKGRLAPRWEGVMRSTVPSAGRRAQSGVCLGSLPGVANPGSRPCSELLVRESDGCPCGSPLSWSPFLCGTLMWDPHPVDPGIWAQPVVPHLPLPFSHFLFCSPIGPFLLHAGMHAHNAHARIHTRTRMYTHVHTRTHMYTHVCTAELVPRSVSEAWLKPTHLLPGH